MNVSKYAAPLSTLLILLAIALIPILGQARTATDTCEDRRSESCETDANPGDTSTSTDETGNTSDENDSNPGENTATSTDPGDENDTTASTTPPADTDTSTSTNETEDDTGDNTGGGGSSGGDDTEVAKISIRGTDRVIVALNQPFTPDETVSITPTDGNPDQEVDGASALALLVALDKTSNNFSITDLQYYPSFGAFFLNCIKIDGENLCGEWQYTVNGDYPSIGLDQYLLDDGDSVFLFFGSPRIVEVPSEVAIGEEFTATALQFDPEENEYTALSRYTIGIVQDNPDDPWSPTEIETKKADKNGEATFTLGTLGEYKVGLEEDYYSPTSPLTVVETVNTNIGSGSSGSSQKSDTSSGVDVDAAIAFINTYQGADGSFGVPLYSDWAAIALAAAGNDDALAKVRNYLKNADGASIHITDHERRAMALMAAGISPYDGTATDHIAAITEAFDGTQIGVESDINDDIFALLVLLSAGYTENDEIIEKVVAHIAARQNENGSWGASVDMTAAGIQALAPLTSDAAVTARAKARAHLKSQQKDDGGFGNSFATSWALMAIAALGETPENWSKNGTTPLAYLKGQQQSDGGLETIGTLDSNRLWATSYAVPAALGKTWLDITNNFGTPTVLAAETSESTTIVTGPITESVQPGTTQNSLTTPTDRQLNTFGFASDVKAITKSTEVITKPRITTKQTKSITADETVPEPETTEKPGFFARFFKKLGSIIFFWR